MYFRPDCYYIFKVWWRLENFSQSYSTLKFYGKMENFVAPPLWHSTSKSYDFDNFLSSKPHEHTRQVSKGSDESPRRSSFKYDPWKWPKNHKNVNFDPKWPPYPLPKPGSPRDFLVRLDMFHTPSKSHPRGWNSVRGLLRQPKPRWRRRAISVRSCARPPKYEILRPTLGGYAKFHEFLGILKPWKRQFIGWKKKENNNKIKAASSDGRALAYARTSKCAHVEMCIISFFITSVLITTRSFRQLS